MVSLPDYNKLPEQQNPTESGTEIEWNDCESCMGISCKFS
jgi:hypothetical protein